AARDRFGELGHGAMTVVESARRNRNSDDWLVQELGRESHRTGKRTAQEAREVLVAVIRQSAVQSLRLTHGYDSFSQSAASESARRRIPHSALEHADLPLAKCP